MFSKQVCTFLTASILKCTVYACKIAVTVSNEVSALCCLLTSLCDGSDGSLRCRLCSIIISFTRTCAVAQYAVLEANAKVNGRGPFSHPLNRFRCHVKYITTSTQGVDVQYLVGIDSAVTDLRMRQKNTVCVDFCINKCKNLTV